MKLFSAYYETRHGDRGISLHTSEADAWHSLTELVDVSGLTHQQAAEFFDSIDTDINAFRSRFYELLEGTDHSVLVEELDAPAIKVWVVSLEWNRAPSEMTGDTGIEGVFADHAAALACKRATQKQFDADGHTVYQFSMTEGRYCATCGQETEQPGTGVHECPNPDDEDDSFCHRCGAETKDTGSCDNDHDEWDVDVHCTEHEVRR